MLYEVFIPSTEVEGYDVTITVDAENWMAALKSGLERTGDGATDIRGVMCDIKDDDSIHVTDAITRRVFVLRELEGEEESSAPEPAAEAAPEPAVHAAKTEPISAVDAAVAAPVVAREPEPKPEPEPEPVVAFDPEPESEPEYVAREPEPTPEPARAREPSGAHVGIGSSSVQEGRAQERSPRVVRETRQRSGVQPAVNRRSEGAIATNILEDIFLEIQVIHERAMTMEDVVNFVMDMAMEKIPAESGAVLFADTDGRELYFATARGPKAGEVMDFRVPMGQGIVGFCAREGVSLAISDAQNHPRFYKKISSALDYPTHSIMCVPVEYEGRVYGCLELINRESGTHFSSHEVNALTYIGNQFAQYIFNLIMSHEKL